MKECVERVQNGPVPPGQQVTEVTEGSVQRGSPDVTIFPMKHVGSRWMAALLACLLLCAMGAAQEHPNFSGNWKLNPDKSSFGAIPPPDSLTYSLRHEGATLLLDYDQDGKKSHLEFTTDGQERVTDSNTESEIWTRVYWAGPVLLFEARDKARPAHESRGIKWPSRWTLSDDGKTLAIQKHLSIPQGETDQKLIFDKQP